MTGRNGGALLDFILAASATGSPFAVATVTNVQPGLAADGNALVTVNLLGTATYATYGDSYTPVMGHVVLVARTQPTTILLRLIGTPPV